MKKIITADLLKLVNDALELKQKAKNENKSGAKKNVQKAKPKPRANNRRQGRFFAGNNNNRPENRYPQKGKRKVIIVK